MESNDQFYSILKGVLIGTNESTMEAQVSYTRMINENPEQLAFMHFYVISTTSDGQFLSLALVLLGTYFTLLGQAEISISPESEQNIKTSLFMLYQNEKFTEYHFDILSNIIFKSAMYFKSNWPELPIQLLALINHPNPYISSSIGNCLSDCIRNSLIDLNIHFNDIYAYVLNSLQTPPEPIQIRIPIILRLFYSLFNSYESKEMCDTLFGIFGLIPNYLPILSDDPKIINDFHFFINNNNMVIFENYCNEYFQVVTNIIASPSHSISIKNTSILILNCLITRFSSNFYENSIGIFNFLTSQLVQKEINDFLLLSISNLSQIYGGNDDFAVHVFDFFLKSIPNPIAFAVMGNAFFGIKEIFSTSVLSNQLLMYFMKGFTSEDEYTRFVAFYHYAPLIKIFYNYDEYSSSSEAMSVLLGVMLNESNPQALYQEIKMLSKLLKYYFSDLKEFILRIVELLDHLLESCQQFQYTLEILKCYLHIAKNTKSEFSPFVNVVNKLTQIIKQPLEFEELFFYCVKFLPYFKSSIPLAIFNDLFSNIMDFVFSMVFKEKQFFQLANHSISCVLHFFLKCIEVVDFTEMQPTLDSIINIAIDVALMEFTSEKLGSDIDLSLYEDYFILSDSNEQKFIAISYDQISKNGASLLLLHSLLLDYPMKIPAFLERILQCCFKLLKTFGDLKIEENLPYIYMIETLIVPYISDYKTFELLLYSTVILFNAESQLFMTNYKYMAKLLLIFIKSSAVKWPESQIFLTLNEITIRLFSSVNILAKIEHDKACQIGDLTYDDQESKKASILFALAFRDLMRYYPQRISEIFPNIISIVNEYQKEETRSITVYSIVCTDLIRFSPEVNSEFYHKLIEFFRSNLQSNFINIQIDSIFGLAVLIDPHYIGVDVMQSIIDLFTGFLSPACCRDIKSMISFALLQIFQKYSQVFDVSTFFNLFFDMFNDQLYQIPKYCLEYYAQSLLFFLANFRNAIPMPKMIDFKNVISGLIKKKLDSSLLEELNLAFHSL